MRGAADHITEALRDSFPRRVAQGIIAPHECEECSATRLGLSGRSWDEVPNDFAEEFSGSLPLLSPDAYHAYLPVWLRAAVENPNGEAASMVAINLSDKPSKEGFSHAQARVLIAVVEFIASHNVWGADDPSNMERVAAVKATWGEGVA